MLISINLKKECKYILYFIPISLIQIILERTSLIKNDINYQLIKSFSMISMIIIYIFEKFRNKSKFEKNDYYNLNNYVHHIILILSSIIFYICYLYLFNFCNKEYKWKNIFIIISIILIDMKLIKKTIYSHQYLSFIFNFISLILIICSNLKIKLDLFNNILIGYCYSFHILILEYINLKYFISIYLLGSINGLSELIFYLIKLYYSQSHINFENLIIKIIYYIIYVIYFYLFYFILQKMGGIHSLLIYYTIYFLLSNFFIYFILLYNIIYIFTIISGLIYLEIIEINCCGLNKNSKKNIQIRSNEEINIILDISQVSQN